MKKNVGGSEKTLRIVLGVLFLVLGYFVSSWFYILAFIAFLTAFTNYCLLNQIIGRNSAESEKTPKETYACEGTCKGVAHEPKNCGDETCTHFDKPLVKQEG